jgi:beta-N-acetylhexosaminidase
MDMAGLGSWCNRKDAMPQAIASGCDVILFSQEPEEDMEAVYQAVVSGTIPQGRFDDAVKRMLGLKAKMGLFEKSDVLPPEELARAEVGSAANKAVATAAIARSPTLVKDVQSLFPLSPAKTRRILFVDCGIVHPLAFEAPKFILPDLLRAEGFEVTVDSADLDPRPEDFDLMLYAFGDESLLTRSHIFIDWMKISGSFRRSMKRYWHSIPTAMLSFGHPYLLYDAPRVPAYINAYNTLDLTQQAVVDCMTGRTQWNPLSPVDPFCGLPDARF